jgi:hypothetical protein
MASPAGVSAITSGVKSRSIPREITPWPGSSLSRSETPPDETAASSKGASQISRERIIAARIEKKDISFGGALHDALHGIELDHFELKCINDAITAALEA